jgi:serine/threonine protein kinase
MSQEDEFGIIGATLANAFHVERVVAHGGFAIVYRGLHGGFRAPIALKCLRIPEGMSEAQTTTFLERFREEGELLFRLSAAIPEVVRPLHIDAVYLPSGALMPFLALEWLDGEGLDQVLLRARHERKGGLDLHALVELLRPVAGALSRAHGFPSERGSLCVVHRDLKPENLFLCHVAGAPAIKILDYGIAEVVSVAQRVSGVRAWRGMNPFTPGYGAPEQWAPDRFGPSGAWTDVWGLALTMTEALAGKPAIDGDVDAMRRIALDPRRRPTPRSIGALVSNDLEAAFQRALALDPRQRTQDIASFWSEIEAAAGLSSTLASHAAPMKRARRGSEVRELSDSEGASIDLDLAVEPESLRGSRLSLSGAAPSPHASSPGMPAVSPPSRASVPGMPAVAPSRTASVSSMHAVVPHRSPSVSSMQAVAPPRTASVPGMQAVAPPRTASVPGMQAVAPPRTASVPGMQAVVLPSRAPISDIPPILRVEEACEAELPMHDDPPISQRMPPSSGPRSVRPMAPASPDLASADLAPTSARGGSLAGPTSTRDSFPGPTSARASLSGAASLPPEAPLADDHGAASEEPPQPHEAAGRRALASPPDSPVLQILWLIRTRFQAPAILLGAAIGLTLIDLAAVRIWGAPLALGPIRSPWVAGPLAVVGGALLIWRIVVDHEDDG